jgi:predicted ATPase
MRALCAAGRQAEALTVYGQGRELLADRLGVDPSAHLEQVYLRILRGEEGLAAVAQAPSRAERPVPRAPSQADRGPRRHSPLTSFVGRDDDLSVVLTNLRAARLVTLTGPGGVGKTRLATEVSGQLDAPAWFVPLAPVTDPAEVAYAVLDTFGVREPVIARRAPESGSGPLERLSAALADRDEVMILDNCEHVIEAAATLAGHILAACPRMRIMVTSRQPLRIDGEVLCPVPPLPVPPAEPGPCRDYGSVRLLRDRAVAVRPDFELDEANAQAAARICRSLDGMPLAIELAAVWLRTLTPAQLAERLDDRFALLVGGSRTALPRHRTLRAVVDWSWDLLSPPEQVLARRLAIFPGGATLAAAEQVCADRLLPAAAALADFAAWSPDAAMTHPIAAMGEPMLALLDRDLDRAFTVFDQHVTSPDPWLRAAVPLMRGQFGSMLGRMEWAESLCQESLAAFRVLDELWGTAVVLVQLAEFAEMRADYETAIAAIDEAASLARELGAWGDLAHISGKHAAIRLRTGDLAQARADLLRAEHEESERGAGQSDSAAWLGLIRAELVHTSVRLRGSSPVVGSSRYSSRGLPTRLAAKSSRRRIPPEYVLAGRAAASESSKRASSSRARALASGRGMPSRRPIMMRLLVPDSPSSTDAYCPVRPMSCRTWWASRSTS